MEVVCLILGPMLASQPCSHAFWVLTSLHLIENVFYYSCNNYDEDFASFATCRFFTLKRIYNCLEDVVSHKNTRYQKVCAY